MNNKLSFGIGCFHFGVRGTPPVRFGGSEYLKELTQALEAIPNLDHIGVDCDDEFKDWSLDVTGELPSLEEGPGLFPKPWHMRIDFEVYIPLRVQAELCKGVSRVRTFTERFKVSIHYTYHLPVTVVESVNPSQRGRPSTAVVIVRRFLERELNTSESGYIKFESLGPSPFHANCYIEPGDPQGDNDVDWDVWSERIPRRGYDDILFYYNEVAFANEEEVRNAVIEEILDELGFFYRVVQTQNARMSAWGRVEGLVGQLIAIQGMKGIRGRLERTFVCSKLINEALTQITVFEANRLYVHSARQRAYAHLYSDQLWGWFQPYIDKRIKQQISYPTGQIGQLVSFLESRRVKSVETLVVLVSALLGGTIGALLTLLLST